MFRQIGEKLGLGDRASRSACARNGCTPGRKLKSWLYRWRPRLRLQDWQYCSPECFEDAACELFRRLARDAPLWPGTRHRIPLGLLLLSRGALDPGQLQLALAEQQSRGHGRLGEWLQNLGFASERQITAALGAQWGCPVLPGIPSWMPVNPGCLPLRLTQSFDMLPIQQTQGSGTLVIAFSESVRYEALYAIEEALQCRTEACVVSRSVMLARLEQLAQPSRRGDLLFEGWRPEADMARITCGYALRLGARQTRIVACGDYIWVRLSAVSGPMNLLFRRRREPAQAVELVG